MVIVKKYLWLVLIAVIISCAAKKKVSTTSSRTNIEEKYALMLATDKEHIDNLKLYSVIDEWYGVKYKYAGSTKEGIDCSGFAEILYKEVYGKYLSGSSAAIYNQSIKINKDSLKEGDLVFFTIKSKAVSHMGIYLQNNKFVHASLSLGVMISDLNEEYYKKHFKAGGRVKY